MSRRADITVLVNAHREGPLLAQALGSAHRAIAGAEMAGRRCELLLVVDRGDAATLAVAQACLRSEDRMLRTQFGDPGPARNVGIEQAEGAALALLDGDDMFGSPWLARGYEMLLAHEFGSVCLHPALTVIFGEERAAWLHIGMEHTDFSLRQVMFENYFTNLSFAPIDVYRDTPFRRSAARLGFGHEDFAWIQDTLHRGVRHLVVPKTLHAVRRRRSSRLTQARLQEHLTIPTPLFSGREVTCEEAVEDAADFEVRQS